MASAFKFNFASLGISHWDRDAEYGTFNHVMSAHSPDGTSDVCRDDLIWSYKQAFWAMAKVKYRNEKELFQSPIIHELRILHRQHQRIAMNDFGGIPPKCIVPMLEHRFVFAEWDSMDIWSAVLLSFKNRKEKHNKCKPAIHMQKLGPIVHKLVAMGHSLFPFHCTTYSDEVVENLCASPVILAKHTNGVQPAMIERSYRQFLSEFGVQLENETQRADLAIIAELLNLTYSAEERRILLQMLWRNVGQYKKSMLTVVQASDLHHQSCWEKQITPIIIGYV